MNLIFEVLIAVGLLLLIIPGLWLFTKYFFTPYFFIQKNLGIKQSFIFSSELTKNRLGKLFPVIFFIFIFSFIPPVLADNVFNHSILLYFLSHLIAITIGTLMNIIGAYYFLQVEKSLN